MERADLQGFWCLDCGSHFWIHHWFATRVLQCPFCSSTELSQHAGELVRTKRQVVNSDSHSRFVSSWTIEEIHRELKEPRNGWVLVKASTGHVSATVRIFLSAEQIEALEKTIEVVQRASAELNMADEQEGANVNQNDKA
jgi:hypothetical protein